VGANYQGAPVKKEKRKATYQWHLPTYLFFRFFEIFGSVLENNYVVFLGSSCRETAKSALKKSRCEKTTGKTFFFPSDFSARSFLHGLSPKKNCGVFELPLLRNAQKRHKKNLKN
jgi:hypothetical protein